MLLTESERPAQRAPARIHFPKRMTMKLPSYQLASSTPAFVMTFASTTAGSKTGPTHNRGLPEGRVYLRRFASNFRRDKFRRSRRIPATQLHLFNGRSAIP